MFPTPGVSWLVSNLETTPGVEVMCKESLPLTGRLAWGFVRTSSGWCVKGSHAKGGSSLSGDAIVVEGDDVSEPLVRQHDRCFNLKDDKVRRPFSDHGGESGWVGSGGNRFDPISPHFDHVPSQLLSKVAEPGLGVRLDGPPLVCRTRNTERTNKSKGLFKGSSSNSASGGLGVVPVPTKAPPSQLERVMEEVGESSRMHGNSEGGISGEADQFEDDGSSDSWCSRVIDSLSPSSTLDDFVLSS